MTDHDRRFDLAALDMAGTTVQEHGAVYASLRGAVEDHLGRPVPDPVFARWTGTSKKEATAGLLREATGSAPDDLVETVYADFHSRLVRRYAETPPAPLPGVEDAVARLRSAGVAVVLQTGYSRDIAESILKIMGWSVGEQIDGLITSDEVAASRPAPYLIFHAMELTGVTDVSRVCAVGDTPNDLGAGSNAGAGLVVGVLTGAHDATALGRHRHTHLLAGVADLPSLL